jgi:hypothetical protein
MKFHVIMAVTKKGASVWDVIEANRRFGGI